MDRMRIGHQFVKFHMIFDVKMEDFFQKSQCVTRENIKNSPLTITYARFVSRETFRLALTIAALDGLQVKVDNIMNAYVTSPSTERIWMVIVPEFGSDAGNEPVIVRALYLLKSSGAAFCNHLADCMRNIGYKYCIADLYLWLKPEVRPGDGFGYYSYILCCVNNILCTHHDSMAVLNKLDK